MTRLYFVTYIKAARERVFDLSRDVDFHTKSATTSRERVIGGRMSGLLEPGETVRFQGYHFGLCLRHTSTLTEFVHPAYFVDEMTEGHFRYFRHEHRFTDEGERTRMEDILHYEVPFGWCGRLFDRLFLRRHLTAFLTERNRYLKEVAEQEVGYPPENRDRLGP
ncbi:MAG TPA: SRPBCC family protein [Flavobacterium sp.]|nr:SRPBCC family protein [Flavobacterium sp.]